MWFLMGTLLKDEVKGWVVPTEYTRCLGLTLSMKQRVNNRTIDNIISSQNFRHFMNLLNRKVHNKRFIRFGVRINVYPVLEVSQGNRYHYHCVIQRPMNVRSEWFKEQIFKCWEQTDWGYDEVHIHEQIDSGWWDYISKQKTVRDEFDWVNYHWKH